METPESPLEQLRHFEHEEFEHVVVLVEHLRLSWLLRHFPPRIIHAVYVLINGFITVAILAALGFATGNPFVFPSVGPTAYLFFFTPMARTASPRNAILGHAIGLICGYAALIVTGASAFPFAAHAGIHWPTILSAALSLSATGAVMILLRVSHPPAGATTLIVSLGIIYHPGIWLRSRRPLCCRHFRRWRSIVWPECRTRCGILAKLPAQGRWDYRNSAKVSRAAVSVAVISSSPCAVLRNAASNCDGGSHTPASIMARWNAANFSVSARQAPA